LVKIVCFSVGILIPLGLSSAAQDVQTAGGNAYAYRSETRFHPEVGQNGMVTAIEHLAAQAGRDILAAGGNAVDAAVARGLLWPLPTP
jgi:gamma-glutamyltranspeptidase / glutathione hydrolase